MISGLGMGIDQTVQARIRCLVGPTGDHKVNLIHRGQTPKILNHAKARRWGRQWVGSAVSGAKVVSVIFDLEEAQDSRPSHRTMRQDWALHI